MNCNEFRIRRCIQDDYCCSDRAPEYFAPATSASDPPCYASQHDDEQNSSSGQGADKERQIFFTVPVAISTPPMPLAVAKVDWKMRPAILGNSVIGSPLKIEFSKRAVEPMDCWASCTPNTLRDSHVRCYDSDNSTALGLPSSLTGTSRFRAASARLQDCDPVVFCFAPVGSHTSKSLPSFAERPFSSCILAAKPSTHSFLLLLLRFLKTYIFPLKIG